MVGGDISSRSVQADDPDACLKYGSWVRRGRHASRIVWHLVRMKH